MPPKTRKQSGDINPDVVFPLLDKFQHPTMLPTIKSVIGVLQSKTAGGKAQTSHDDAVREVAKLVFSKWFHDTVYCIALHAVVKRIRKIWEIFREGRKRFNAGRNSGPAIDAYSDLVADADKLFDIGPGTLKTENLRQARVTKCFEEWGVAMTEQEYEYYEDQKTERRRHCDHGVDPVWYCAMMRQERLKRRQEEYRKQQEEQFAFKDMEEITNMLREEMGPLSSTDTSIETPEKPRNTRSSATLATESSSKKRKLFIDNREASSESIDFPKDLAHIRHSERNVRNELYLTVATLLGHGLSFNEAMHAVVDVGNGMFLRKWKHPDKESETYDLDTLPVISNILYNVDLIEAETLSFAVDKITEAKGCLQNKKKTYKMKFSNRGGGGKNKKMHKI